MKRLIKYIIKEIHFYIPGLIFLFAIDYLQLFIPKLIGKAIDSLKEMNPTFEKLLYSVLSILVVTILVTVGRFLWRILIFGTSRRIEYKMRNDLFWHLENLDTNFFVKNKTGDLMAYFTNDLAAVRMLIGPGIAMSFDAVVMLIMIIYKTMKDINIILTLLALIPLPLISVGALFFSKVIQQRFKEKQEAFSKLTDFVQEAISGIRVIKAFVKEKTFGLLYHKVNSENFSKNLKLVQTFSLLFPMVALIVGLSLLITLIYGSYLTIIGVITLGSFVAFIQYIDLLIWPMIALGWSINIFSQGVASQKRIDSIFNTKREITDKDADFTINKIESKITIRNLTFTYPGSNKKALDNINLEIKEGETIGIIGKIGSGKTTLANLLLRLYEAPDSSIYIGNYEIKKIPLSTLRRKIGFVTQDVILFSDSIKNNIALTDINIDESRVVEIAKKSLIHENIIEFPEKYETVIGERGINLSGGQKQRIALSRALLVNNDILIIDDSLSAVDTKTEEGILSNLKEIRKGKTTIIISHRVSVLQISDRIIVLDDGRIIEQGNPKALLKNNGFYAKLYKKQTIEEELEKMNAEDLNERYS